MSCGHDLAIANVIQAANPTQAPKWCGFEAAKLLKQHIKNGKHPEMKPNALQKMKKEHEVFDPAVFQKHICQEVDKEPMRVCQFEKKKKRWQFPKLRDSHPRMESNKGKQDECKTDPTQTFTHL